MNSRCGMLFPKYCCMSEQKVRLLLAVTDYPITDIALNCGFSNPSYFSRQFEEFMGSTPGEYRAIAKTTIPAAANIRETD